MTRLLNRPAVLEVTGDSRSLHIENVKQGLFPEPLEGRGSYRQHWPDFEVEKIILARIAGKNPDEIRVLVRQLIDERARAADPVAA